MAGFTPSTAPWTTARLAELGPDEHDFQEFKGSAWLFDGKAVAGWFHAALSKQVSAFANSAGGRLFIGIDDLGQPDGGVPVHLKPGGTRSWLEDVVRASVSPQVARFNVFELRGGDPAIGIKPEHAVYVVELPSSEDAPHQALDHRYYLRIAGKSQPMGHVHVQDVLRRTRSPVVELVRLGPYGAHELDQADPRGPRAFVCLRAFLRNQGRTLAHHVGVELSLPRQVVGKEVRRRNLEQQGVHLSQFPGTIALFRYHPAPLFPSQEIYAQSLWIGLHTANREAVESGALVIRWRVWADDATPTVGARPLHSFGVVRAALAELPPASTGATGPARAPRGGS